MTITYSQDVICNAPFSMNQNLWNEQIQKKDCMDLA